MKKYRSVIEMTLACMTFGPAFTLYFKYNEIIMGAIGRTGVTLLLIVMCTVCYVTYDYIINKIK